MAKKVLVPVFPSERFYEAVVRAADILEDEGGILTFVFTRLRPDADAYDAEGDGRANDLDGASETDDAGAVQIERWREAQVAGLEDARQLLYERGIRDDQIDYLFADEADTEGAAQAIADEAAAGAYDAVVLSRGYFENDVRSPGETTTPEDMARAIQELDGVALIVT